MIICALCVNETDLDGSTRDNLDRFNVRRQHPMLCFVDSIACVPYAKAKEKW